MAERLLPVARHCQFETVIECLSFTKTVVGGSSTQNAYRVSFEYNGNAGVQDAIWVKFPNPIFRQDYAHQSFYFLYEYDPIEIDSGGAASFGLKADLVMADWDAQTLTDANAPTDFISSLGLQEHQHNTVASASSITEISNSAMAKDVASMSFLPYNDTYPFGPAYGVRIFMQGGSADVSATCKINAAYLIRLDAIHP